MKKLLLLLLLFPLWIYGQNFPLVKEGAIWRILRANIPHPPDPYVLHKFQYYMGGDTVLMNKPCKKVYSTNYGPNVLNKIYIGGMSEDSLGKIYFIRDSAFSFFNTNLPFEILLYDFSLNVTDTFRISNPCDSVHIVESIDSIMFSGKWRKRINFIIAPWGKRREWVEGVGDLKELFYPLLWEFEIFYLLVCYEDSQVYWTNPKISFNCLSLGISDVTVPRSNLKISPNPANTEITIEFAEGILPEEKEIYIYNASGAEVKKAKALKGENDVRIDISSLRIGVYFGRVIGASGKSGVFRFVKE